MIKWWIRENSEKPLGKSTFLKKYTSPGKYSRKNSIFHENRLRKKIRKGSGSAATSSTTIFGHPTTLETHPPLVKWSLSERFLIFDYFELGAGSWELFRGSGPRNLPTGQAFGPMYILSTFICRALYEPKWIQIWAQMDSNRARMDSNLDSNLDSKSK